MTEPPPNPTCSPGGYVIFLLILAAIGYAAYDTWTDDENARRRKELKESKQYGERQR